MIDHRSYVHNLSSSEIGCFVTQNTTEIMQLKPEKKLRLL